MKLTTTILTSTMSLVLLAPASPVTAAETTGWHDGLVLDVNGRVSIERREASPNPGTRQAAGTFHYRVAVADAGKGRLRVTISNTSAGPWNGPADMRHQFDNDLLLFSAAPRFLIDKASGTFVDLDDGDAIVARYLAAIKATNDPQLSAIISSGLTAERLATPVRALWEAWSADGPLDDPGLTKIEMRTSIADGSPIGMDGTRRATAVPCPAGAAGHCTKVSVHAVVDGNEMRRQLQAKLGTVKVITWDESVDVEHTVDAERLPRVIVRRARRHIVLSSAKEPKTDAVQLDESQLAFTVSRK
jgi:hypothetical protein